MVFIFIVWIISFIIVEQLDIILLYLYIILIVYIYVIRELNYNQLDLLMFLRMIVEFML
jgi:hypothetical protein